MKKQGEHMRKPRAEAIGKVLADLEAFQIDHQAYFDDAEPQGWYDAVLTGKVKSLFAFCRVLGWSELVSSLETLLPLQGDAPSALEQIQAFVIPEAKRLLETTDVESTANPNDAYWQLIHPRIRHLAQPRFESGFHGDAVECCFKEVNDVVKQYVRGKTGKELDGSGLMTLAFSPTNPVIVLDNLDTETGRAIQQGYMQIFAGSMTGIRNPKAHGNLHPDASKALHLICLASLLMTKFDERIECDERP
ncbi:TIGR02391 family protein [Burkholderia pseudomallei]|uniref:TIGR02391 family protein n=1 Tax=Burkholderia pseudomallei TaxID=28450 RepID=UPI0009B1AFFE|nr:TIGR02391 family protein [Burkholderia pseudomallei]